MRNNNAGYANASAYRLRRSSGNTYTNADADRTAADAYAHSAVNADDANPYTRADALGHGSADSNANAIAWSDCLSDIQCPGCYAWLPDDGGLATG